MTAAEFAPRGTSRPVTAAELSPSDYDAEVDVVVVGGGGGGLPAALFARWLGNDVVVLEKAGELGGTASKAAFWYWVPNNAADAGTRHRRHGGRLPAVLATAVTAAALRRRPVRRSACRQWEYDLCRGDLRQSASEATELLNERGAIVYRHCAEVPDYWSELDEDATPTGRVLVPAEARESMSDGGRWRPHDERGRRARRRPDSYRASGPAGHHLGHGRWSASRPRRPTAARHASAPARRSSSRPVASPTMQSCGRTSSACPSTAGAPRCRTRATSCASRRRSEPSCATCSTPGCARSRWRRPSRRTPTSPGCSRSPATR